MPLSVFIELSTPESEVIVVRPFGKWMSRRMSSYSPRLRANVHVSLALLVRRFVSPVSLLFLKERPLRFGDMSVSSSKRAWPSSSIKISPAMYVAEARLESRRTAKTVARSVRIFLPIFLKIETSL